MPGHLNPDKTYLRCGDMPVCQVHNLKRAVTKPTAFAIRKIPFIVW